MTIEERKKRIIARGEHSDHAHVLTCEEGAAHYDADAQRIILGEKNSPVYVEHILESKWLEGVAQEAEHFKVRVDINRKTGERLPAGTRVKYIPQLEFDPAEKKIREVND